MTFRTKQRVIRIGFVILIIWPLVRHLLVRTTPMGAWKLAGWSMYCEPYRAIEVTVVRIDRGRDEPLRADRLLKPQRKQSDRAMHDFRLRRTHFGEWASPDGYAETLLGFYPEVDGIRIDVRQTHVNRATAMTV